jgi:hypothetical protein
MDHNNVRNGLRNTKRTAQGHSENEWNLTSGVVLLHVIVHPHTRTAAHTRALLQQFNWEFLTNLLTALISLQATISSLPTWRTGCVHSALTTITEGVRTCLGSKVADFFDRGTQKLISWYDKCLNSIDDDTEK